jgi:CRP-like cAMP-binding protein
VTVFDQSPPAPSVRNRLLGALPPEDLAVLWPRLEPVELELRQVLHVPEQPVQAVYFVETGWISMVAALEDGDGAEVGLIGYEGMLGLPLLLDSEFEDLEGIVQCPGMALRLSAADFREALEQLPTLRRLLNRYAVVHHGQVTRTAACNGRHDIAQRLARWLLMAHDRAEGDTYPMTHEFLSMMLGVRRAGVSTAASVLQRAGLIRYSAGRMTITDRPGLENSSCECYGMQRRASERLFGLDGNRAIYRR